MLNRALDPTVGLLLMLLTNCSDADTRTPASFLIDSKALYTIFFHAICIAGLISDVNNIPNNVTLLIVVGDGNETGFTGTQHALS